MTRDSPYWPSLMKEVAVIGDDELEEEIKSELGKNVSSTCLSNLQTKVRQIHCVKRTTLYFLLVLLCICLSIKRLHVEVNPKRYL